MKSENSFSLNGSTSAWNLPSKDAGEWNKTDTVVKTNHQMYNVTSSQPTVLHQSVYKASTTPTSQVGFPVVLYYYQTTEGPKHAWKLFCVIS